MIKVVFGFICLLSVIVSILSGNIEQIGYSVIEGAGEAVQLSLILLGVMCLWSGIMRVLDASGALKYLTFVLSPLLRVLYPDAARKNNGIKEIAAAMTANFFGLGNAATSLSLAAIGKLQENNIDKQMATADMITFTVLSTSSISFVPTTLIALRYAAGSSDPFEIVVPIWICSLSCFILCAMICRGFALASENGKKSSLYIY